MGYYSDVAIGIAFPNKEAATAFLCSVRLNNKMPPDELAHYKVTIDPDMVVLHARFEEIKWYEAYPHVQCHHGMLGLAGDQDYGTAFVRVGEDYGDIECEISGEFDLWEFFGIRREVVSPDDGIALSEFINTTKE